MLENSTNKLVYQVKTSNVFAFPVPFTSPSDIACYLEEESQLAERKLAPGEFTVESKSDYSEGADITLNMPLPVGKNLAIVRECPITQLVDFPEFGKFPASANEKALDKLTMICQQLWETLERCVKLSITSGQKPQDIIDIIIGAKDMSLTAAASAANANASASAAALTVQTIWAEITGNDASAQEALEALKQAFEAAGSVEAAAAAGRESVNAASLAAVEYAQGQIEESKDASLSVLTATTANRKQELLALISETVGAEGTVAAAVKAAQDAQAAAESAAGGVDAAAQEAIASVNAAAAVAGEYRNEAQAKAAEAEAQAKAAGDSAAEAYGYIADTLANKNASAESAQKAAEEAAKAELSANAAAGAAGEAATTAAQKSITLHNSRIDAHDGILLSIKGGTMTGNIMVEGSDWGLTAKNNETGIHIYDETAPITNSTRILSGESYIIVTHPQSVTEGHIVMQSVKGSQAGIFDFAPDGTLTVNGVKALIGSNTKYPNERITRGSANSYICINAGDTDANGGHLYLYGKAWTAYSGGFFLRTSEQFGLLGLPNYTLLWNGRDITMGFPNYGAGTLITSPTSSSMFVAPSDGFYVVAIAPTTVGTSSAYVNGNRTNFWGGYDGDYGNNRVSTLIPLKMGDTLYFNPVCANNGIFYPVR